MHEKTVLSGMVPHSAITNLFIITLFLYSACFGAKPFSQNIFT